MPRIHYRSLKFSNGYAYRECEIPFEDQGLVLLRGLNLDDGGFLGAGKTSPFEVFSLLQTGKVGKQRKGERILADDVVNLSVGEGFEARLQFDVDGHPYEIVQCRLHSKFGNAYRIIDVDTGRDLLPNENRMHPQQWTLKEVLGLDDKSFFNLVYMAQDFSNIMLHGTDGDRQQNLIQMFGLDVYDKLFARTKQKLSALQMTARDVVALQEELDDIDAELKQQDATPEQLALLLTEARVKQHDLQLQHDTALDQQEDLQDRLRDLQIRSRYIQDAKDLWGQLKRPPIEDVRQADQQLADDLKGQVEATNEKLLDLKNALRLIDQRHIIETKLSSLGSCDLDETDQELTRVRDDLRRLINKDLPRAERRLEIIQDLRKLQKPNRDSTVVREELEAAKDLRRDTEKEIQDIKAALENDVCPTCGRAYDEDEHDADEYKQRLQRLQTTLATHATDAHDLGAELKNVADYEDLKKRLGEIEGSSNPTDIQRNIGQLSSEERRLVSTLEAENLRETLQAQLDNLPKESAERLRAEKMATEKAAHRLQVTYDVVRRVVEKLVKIQELPRGKISAIKQRLIAAKRVLRETNNDILGLGERIGKLERQHEKLDGLTKRKTKIEVGIQKTEKTQVQIKCFQALEKVFGSKGLKRERFVSILADATEQTVPYYTDLLWPRRNTRIALAEAGNAVKFELHRGDLVTSSRQLSGGERSKAGLSLLFGMRDLKEKYTDFRTNVLIVDEPFGNLDAYGTECLLNVLQDLRGRFGTVMVIGNQRDVLTHDIWDQVWWAVRENNEARLYRNGLPERYRPAVERYTRQYNG
ncbi:hypothetical protein LCGC14_0829540 [marine sediment metagenome]|uniref:Rad50/SbcC-type AAA domain-containing protein n=1 Tax=marine sediment metagenome TaxID=412755 RepID=A0A0F9PL40_9ZZZZ